jgi:2-polyprenyl-6-hydroxyphenyl methylase/3-demethylubiquinone-9 3-methyltransferase
MSEPSVLRTFLWYSDGLHDALNFYKATFGDGLQIAEEHLFNPQVFTAEFSLYGQKIIGMNTPGGDRFNSAISLSVQVDGQAETDRLWEAITANGEPGSCGWCKDQWGVSWQITPFQMQDFVGHSDPTVAQRNWGILMEMTKIQLSDFVS